MSARAFTLWRLAWRRLHARLLLVAVALVGLACGVGAVTATQLLHAAVMAAYDATMERFAGRAALQVSNGDSGVPDDLVDALRLVDGVRAVAASAAGWVSPSDHPGERLYLYGVDLLADPDVRDYEAGSVAVVPDPVAFLAAPDSVALTRTFAAAKGWRLGDRVRVLTPSGTRTLTIRALLGTQRGPASVLDGRLAVVDLSVAQDLLGLGTRVSELAVVVRPGADLAAVERAIASRVGSRGIVERPRTRVAAFARLLANHRHGLAVAAAVATVVALYLVVNMATLAVAERRRELGLLRTVGASGRTVAALVLLESAVVSALGAGLGLALGVPFARWLAPAFGGGVSALYGEIVVPSPALTVPIALWSLGLGTVAPVLAAGGAMRPVLGIGPLEAVRADVPVGRGSVRLATPACAAGLLLLAAAIGVWLGRGVVPIASATAGTTAMVGMLVGLACTVPTGLRALVRLADRIGARTGDALVLLACRRVRYDGPRIAVTGAAVLVSLGGTIAVGGWVASLAATLDAAFDAVFADVDLVVSGGADPFAAEAVRIPGRVVDAIGAWPEVARAGGFRVERIAFGGSLAAVVARDAGGHRADGRGLHMVEGDAREAAAALRAGTAVVVNQVFARRFGYRRGDVLTVPTPGGALRLRIAGIHLDLTPGDLGTIQLDRRLYRRWWGDDGVHVIEIALADSARRSAVAARVRARWAERHGVVVFTAERLRAAYEAMLGRLTTLVRPLLCVAIASAVIGFVSSSALAALARRRPHAVLRAVGATRAQTARSHAYEALVVAASTVVAALPVGFGLGWTQVEVLLRGMLGMSVVHAYAWDVALAGSAAVVATAGATGWLLGRYGLPEALHDALASE